MIRLRLGSYATARTQIVDRALTEGTDDIGCRSSRLLDLVWKRSISCPCDVGRGECTYPKHSLAQIF